MRGKEDRIFYQPKVFSVSRPLAQSIPLALLAGLSGLWVLRWVREHLKRRQEEESWINHEDYYQIQACLLSSEHLQELGRIEKRTLFCKPLYEVFGGNSYVVQKLISAAKETTENEPVVTVFLGQEDKWHILNACTNHLSALFAPYHVFFNEARRVESYYRSAWYAFTLTCTRSKGAGRFFITPFHPVTSNDVGALRIRIILVNEQELRDIMTGETQPPEWGFFNSRHQNRWEVMKRFAELFERQLVNVSGNTQSQDADWGSNLCGRLGANNTRERRQNNPSTQAQEALKSGMERSYHREDNCFLRMHIPFPTAKGVETKKKKWENKTADVVLFE